MQDGKGCTTVGVCGKDPFTAGLQDLLIHALKGKLGSAVSPVLSNANNLILYLAIQACATMMD